MIDPVRANLEKAALDPEFDDVSDLANVRVDLRYGSTNNILGRDVYGAYGRALLHREAGAMFRRASALLAERHPGLTFIIFDSLRPQAAQEAFWALVAGTPQQPYFADPKKGSIHSYGFAIDLSLLDAGGRELDMGTGFDDLSPLAEPRKEEEFLSNGSLTASQVANRKILRSVMTEAGFLQLPHEWWHYDALPAADVRARYRRVE
jgi:zinc D-Ala-D-Ala dipeptidase